MTLETPADSRTAPEFAALGPVMLGVFSTWDWVDRRCDSFAFVGDDERILSRRQSIDFNVPGVLREAQQTLGLRDIPIPITVVDKWRILELSLRDGRGKAVSLLPKNQSTAISAAMLTTLAGREYANGQQSGSDESADGTEVPSALRDVITKIVCGERTDALHICATFVNASSNAAGEGDASESEKTRVQAWARVLATNESFMGLAFELARGFVLFVRYPSKWGDRAIIKVSYSSYVIPATRDSYIYGVAFGHFLRTIRNRARDRSETSAWRRDGADQPTGRFVITALVDESRKPTGGALPIREREPELACALVTIRGGRTRRTLRVRPNAAVDITGLSDGTYEVRMKAVSGFAIVDCLRHPIKITNGMTSRLTIHVERSEITRRVVRANPKIATPATLLRRVLRGLSWSSKPLAIRVRLGEGGSYHCEFEAPAGMHVTRAKLVSDGLARSGSANSTVDLKLESIPIAHLYAPATSGGQPTPAYVLLNLRPRVETVPRPAYLTAMVALATVIFVAWAWSPRDGFPHGPEDASAILVLLLGAPGALTAFYAQKTLDSRVTNSMLHGLRLAALLPGLIPLICGALLLVGRVGEEGENDGWSTWPVASLEWPLTVLIGAGAIALAIVSVAAYAAEHPPEQRKTDGGQGEGFRRALLGELDRPEAGKTPIEQMLRDDADAEEIRGEMLDRAGGRSREARNNLLGKNVLWRYLTPSRGNRRDDIAPALYFESAQTPPTFPALGPRDSKPQAQGVTDDV